MAETNYRDIERKLTRFDSELKKQTRAKLRELSVEVANLARARASWSAKIPPLIKPTATQAGAGVRIAGRPTPIGVLNERKAGEWRHPVFGNRDAWVVQKAHPSLRPTMEAERPRLRKKAEEIVREALAKAGI